MAHDGSVLIKIVGDDSNFSGKLKGLGGSAASVMKVAAAGAVAATSAVAALGKAAVDAYADYEQLVGGVETLFKDSAGTLQEYAANAYQTAGMSANAYMESVTSFSASLLQSLGGDTEKAAKMADMAVTDMADNANKMGTSIDSLIQTYQSLARGNFAMLDNLKLGYGGTKAELERLLEDAEKISGISYDISSFADIVDAIHVVQTEMGITGTTAKEASETISGSVAAVKASWQNMMVGIADENADFDVLLSNLISSVGTAAENVLPRIKVILEGIANLVVEMAPTLVTTAVDLVTSLAQYISDNAPILLQKAPELVAWLAETIAENAPKLLDAAGQLIVSLATGVIGAVPTLVAKAPEIVGSLAEGIGGMLDSMVQAGINLIDGVAAGIKNAIPNLLKSAGEAATSLLNKVKSVFKIQSPSKVMRDEIGVMLIEGIAEGIIESGSAAVEAAANISDKIISKMASMKDSLQGFGGVSTFEGEESIDIAGIAVGADPKKLDEKYQSLIEGMAEREELLTEYLEEFNETLTALGDSFKIDYIRVGKNWMEGLAEGIKNNSRLVIYAIVDVINESIKIVRSLLGIASPSKVMAEIGRYMAQGLSVGWTDEMSTVTDTIGHSLSDSVEARMTNAFSRMKNALTDGMNQLTGDVAIQARGVNSYTTNTTTNEGALNITIEKVVNEGKGTVTGMMEEFEFIRRQKAMAKGGA